MQDPTVLTKQQIEQIFDGAAASYDRVGPSIFERFGLRLLQGVPIDPGMSVLDIATGKGAVLVPAARRVGPQGHVIGVDLSTAILREAQKAIDASGLRNVELRRMDAESLDFPEKSFDVVTCAFALFMYPDMDAALSEMHRVCKPDGYVAVTYFNRRPPPFDPGWRVFAQQSKEYQVGMRMPQQLGLAPEEMGAILGRFGFHTVKTETEINDIVYETGEDWWDFMMTLGSRATILSMDDQTRARFKSEYLAKLLPAWSPDGLHMSTAVIYATAKR